MPRAQKQDRPEVQEQRREFRERLAGVDQEWRVFVDECRANTAMTRAYGRTPAGECVDADTPGRRDSITLTRGMRLAGAMVGLALPRASLILLANSRRRSFGRNLGKMGSTEKRNL